MNYQQEKPTDLNKLLNKKIKVVQLPERIHWNEPTIDPNANKRRTSANIQDILYRDYPPYGTTKKDS